MKKQILTLFISALLLAACKSRKEQVEVQVTNKITNHDLLMSHAIHRDTANMMIASYLESINDSNALELRSLSFDADQLRFYLNDTTNGRITRLKIMFAHTKDWLDAGNQGMRAGTKAGALTVVLAGYDTYGNYVYIGENGNHVLDYAVGCPTNCQSTGGASSDLLN